jgi:hypothetical protein
MLQATPLSCLVCGATGMVDVWRNVVLFLPLGAGLALLGVRSRHAALAGLMLSLLVETLQLTVVVGRDSSLSDLLTNTLGSGLSALLVHHWRSWVMPAPSAARRLSAVALAWWLAALALTGLGLRWTQGRGPYHLNPMLASGGRMRAFEGTVHAASLNGASVTTGRHDLVITPEGASDTLRLQARVTPSYPPGMLRPIIWLFGPDRSEALIFGQRRDALVLRLHTVSSDARFASPTFALQGALPEGVGETELWAEVTPTAVTLRSRRAGDERVTRVSKRLSLGWMLAMPQGTTVRWPALVSALWLALLVLPLAFWSTRAAATRRGRVAWMAAAAAVAAGGAALLGPALRLAPLHGADWWGTALGMAIGWSLGASITHLCPCPMPDAKQSEEP